MPKLLDYGAGWGDFLYQAKSAGLTNLFGLEFDDRKIEYARDNGIRLGEASWIEKNKPYNMFICNQVLEHLSDPKAALKTLRSLLKPGSVGYLAVPDFDDEFLAEQIRRINSGESFTKNICPIEHLNYFSPESLREMVAQCQFEEITPKTPQSTFFSVFLKPLRLEFRPSHFRTVRTNLYLKAI